jgi:hypothetical protein
MLIFEIATGLGMMVLTVIVHALFMVAGVRAAEWRRFRFGPTGKMIGKAFLLSLLTVWIFLAIALEVVLWALLYLFNPKITALPDLETAFYFSMVTFTTLGYGDVVLTGQWRTLASIQAANGVIIFGWTTALIFYFIQKIYQKEKI